MKAIPVLAALLIAFSACEFERNDLLEDARNAFDNAQSPFGFHVTSVTDTSITLEWTADAEYPTYRLYRDMNFDMPAAILIYEGTGTFFYDSPLSSDTTYYYKLCGVDTTGGEKCSKTIEARTGILPGGTSITSHTAGMTEITLNWSPATNAKSYEIIREGTVVGNTTLTSFTDRSGLSPGTTYQYQVQAVNDYGYGPLSSQYGATTLSGNIPGPTSILQISPSSTAVYLQWSVSTDATEYRLERSSSSDFSIIDASINNITTTNYTNTAIPSSTQYYYRVKGVNGFGEGTFSSVISATTTSDTFTSIGHSMIQGQSANLTSGDVLADTIVPGDIFFYQTSDGYLGKFEVQGVQNHLVIRWVTYNIDGSAITSQGQGMIINLNDNCDLDSGVAGPSVTGDFYWGWDPLTLIPNGALFYEFYSAGP